MSRIGTFLFGVIVGGCLVYSAQRFHVLRTEDGLETVPKISATFSETFVDIRGFDASDWLEHKELAAAVIRAEKQHLLKQAVADTVQKQVDRWLDDLGGDRRGVEDAP